jgi:amino acid adenylation domain-containing protein
MAEIGTDVADGPADSDVVSIFRKRVRDGASRIALRDRDRSLSYQALDALSDRLAGALSAAGVVAGGRVALALDRSIEAIAAMLATLKLGAAFMPLELDAPLPYLQDLLDRFSPDCLLTGGKNSRQIAQAVATLAPAVRVLPLQKDGIESDFRPAGAPSAAAPAYVMFTSGSTGKPKGVVVPHRAIVRLVQAPNYIEIAPDDVFLQLAPMSFDASTFEIWGALLNGATLVLMPPGLQSLPDITRAVEDFGITTLWLTAGLFHLMTDARPETFGRLRWLLAGGDVLSPGHVRRALSAMPRGRLINGYGPTENTTFSCCWAVPRDWRGEDVPIGRPITGSTAHILDDALQPVPPGMPGELYVGGQGVALGYLDDPDASARVFLPDPFATEAGGLLYRTGDLASIDTSGLIRFLGRADDQVKVNGRRIDPAEVAGACLALPGILQAAVLPFSPAAGRRELRAFLVAAPDSPILDAAEARRLLAERLPRPLLPTRIDLVPALPLTPSGKVDRRRLLAIAEPATAATPFGLSDTTQAIAALWARQLGLEHVEPQANFFDLGGTSLQLMALHAELDQLFPGRFALSDLFDHSTVTAQAAFLAPKPAPTPVLRRPKPTAEARDAIAIIGMAGRFPGADTPDALWRNLRAGRESITRFEVKAIDDPLGRSLAEDPHYIRARSVLEDIELFDAEFFGFLPREAALADPQQRLFLEVAWQAFEDAGYDPRTLAGPAAVFAGSSINTYLLNHVLASPEQRRRFTGAYQVGEFATLIGNGADFLATRTAYKLGLRGPAMTVQAACATSLLAVAEACKSLRSGEADLALAGGVSITLPQRRGYLHQAGGMVSPDGHCRPFDAEAAGTVFGHGAGAVLLKRLDQALADGDAIRAVILGSGLSNDGAAKLGYAAPSVDGQAAAIARAHDDAGISPDTISYVECHGTGTPLGDPIEIAGLARAFSRGTARRQFCALGATKANLGHLDVAAGVTGLIKTALALENREVPPLLHWRTPNPAIDFAATPFYVNDRLRHWPAEATPRRAGVSAFGVGGTNVHLVLEEAPRTTPDPTPAGLQLFPLAARSEAALAEMQARLADHLEARPEQPLADIAFTLQTGRAGFKYRAVHQADHRPDLVKRLRGCTPARPAAEETLAVDLLFPGQGAQHPGMGAGLYAAMPVYRDAIDRCAVLLEPLLGLDLRQFLLADPGDRGAAEALRATELAQPALFSVSWALSRLWDSIGIRPGAMIGHSIGELVAAAIAGVMPVEDALMLVAARGKAMQAMPPGRMLAVRLPEAELTALLPAALDLAVVNGKASCVVAGPEEEIARFEQILQARDVGCRTLRTSHAFHSRMMEPAVAVLQETAAKLRLSTPAIPIVSTVTGRWLTPAEATDPGYWARHLRLPVRFSDALALLVETRRSALIEAGPGRTLTTLARQHDPARIVLPSLRDPLDEGVDAAIFLDAVGRLWAGGSAIDWRGLHAGGQRRRVPLPTYPFERSRHWIDAPDEGRPLAAGTPPDAIAAASPRLLETPPMPDAAPPKAEDSGLSRASSALSALIEDVAGIDIRQVPAEASFLEMGFDSLVLTQLAQALRRSFGVEILFRQLTTEFAGPQALAAHILAAAPDRFAAPAPVAIATPAPNPLVPVAAGNDQLVQLMQLQLQTMQQMMATLLPAQANPPPVAVAPVLPAATAEKSFGPFKPLESGSDLALSATERALIDGLIARADTRTPGSKRLADRHRAVLADPRVAAGYRREWKDLVYPLATVGSGGSKLVDIDGNAYVDLLNGFGPTAFGHAPDFVTRAIAEQLEKGFEIGPMTPLAGEVAELVRDLTGNERVTFCNTGSEAVMAAMRIARTVTGRMKIVTFAGDYHGQFDEVLVKGFVRDGQPRVAPIAPGIPKESVANIVVLEHGSPDSLAWIEAHADELAAVLIEPVQSRHPDAQRPEFLHALRRITEAAGTALILDEIVTGFRLHPGGVQALWGVRADLVTYGKVVGGGMPIGVLAGKARFMDALDGGTWQYGDESGPSAGVTFFAGTFVRHPLALAAAGAVLRHVKDSGPGLQDSLNRRADRLAEDLNRVLAAAGAPVHVEHFGSVFYFKFPPEIRLASLFWHLLRERGVHHQEGFPFFLTTAHGEADLEQVVAAFAGAAEAMAAAGCFGTVKPARIARMTEAQMEIWLASQFGPAASSAFNESVTLTLEGDLDPAALDRAIARLVNRRDALRLRFSRTGETFTVAPSVTPLIRRAVLNPDRRQADFDAVVAAEAETPFDLVEGPLIRFVLATDLAPGRHALVMTAHHIICDGWSIGLLLAELGPLYDAERSGTQASLPIPAAFADFAAEAQPGAEAALAYWRERFSTVPEPLDLPGDRPRPAERSFKGGTRFRTIDATGLTRIRQAGARRNTTLFVTLLSGFAALLARLGDQEELAIGVPTAAQSGLAPADLVGHCVNFLPIRAKLDRKTRFAELLAQLREEVLSAQDHQACTFGTLVRELGLARSVNRLPLIDVQFNLERVGTGLAFADIEARVEANAKAFVNFDLFLNVVEAPDRLILQCDYNGDLFDPATIDRWLGHYQTLLEGAAEDMDRPVASLPLIAGAERARLLDALAGPAAAIPPIALHELIARRAERGPQRIALRLDDRTMSYRQLESAAERLAHRIAAAGVSPGMPVAVLAERGFDLVIALLAVLKTGAFYVPLDPANPPARTSFILGDCGARLLVTAGTNLSEQSHPGLQVMTAADDGLPVTVRTITAVAPEALAYRIYTSGSTGQPKGVDVTHHALVNLLAAMSERPGIAEDDVLFAVTTPSFDIAALELFLPLLAGATVAIADSDILRDGLKLRLALDAADATMMQATPATWSLLLEAGWHPAPGLKLLCGGERLPPALAARLLEGGAELWNMYGPTETTVWSATQQVRSADDIRFGRPIANTRGFLLDRLGGLAAPGVAGELAIAGDGLARGYHGRADLTAEKFRPLPGLAERAYLTGDRARLDPEGRLTLLGRLDEQVKLRGYRIELGEIEAALARAAGTPRVAAALMSAEGGGDAFLAGFVESGPVVPPPEVLRETLRQTLPDWMIPARILVLDALPQTANGKLDRKALPKLDAPATAPHPIVPARNPTERALVGLWQEVLSQAEIGVTDDLFMLGADSIQIFRIVARAERLGLRLDAASLLRHRTIERVAQALELSPAPDETPAAPIRAAARQAFRIDLAGRPS